MDKVPCSASCSLAWHELEYVIRDCQPCRTYQPSHASEPLLQDGLLSRVIARIYSHAMAESTSYTAIVSPVGHALPRLAVQPRLSMSFSLHCPSARTLTSRIPAPNVARNVASLSPLLLIATTLSSYQVVVSIGGIAASLDPTVLSCRLTCLLPSLVLHLNCPLQFRVVVHALAVHLIS